MFLLRLLYGHWKLSKDGLTLFSGNLESIKLASEKIGFDPAEIDLAVSVMDAQGHDEAEFGIRRRFIFSRLINEFTTLTRVIRS